MWQLSTHFSLLLTCFGAATLLLMQSEEVLVGLRLTDCYAAWTRRQPRAMCSALNRLPGRSIEHYRHKRWFPVSEGKPAKAQLAYHRCDRCCSIGYRSLVIRLPWSPV